jgi:hypothetical protein
MPQPRKYANRAQKPAAYRDRCAAALRAQKQAKGLPGLPAIPAMPKTDRGDRRVPEASRDGSGNAEAVA